MRKKDYSEELQEIVDNTKYVKVKIEDEIHKSGHHSLSQQGHHSLPHPPFCYRSEACLASPYRSEACLAPPHILIHARPLLLRLPPPP